MALGNAIGKEEGFSLAKDRLKTYCSFKLGATLNTVNTVVGNINT